MRYLMFAQIDRPSNDHSQRPRAMIPLINFVTNFSQKLLLIEKYILFETN